MNITQRLDEWFSKQQGAATMILIDHKGRMSCILRSGTATIGRVGEGPDSHTAIMNALSRPPGTIPNRPAREIVTRPVTNYETRDDLLLPGM